MKKLTVFLALIFLLNACSAVKETEKVNNTPVITVAYINSDDTSHEELSTFLNSKLDNVTVQFVGITSAEDLRGNILQGICADIVCTDDIYTVAAAVKLSVFDNITEDDIKKYAPGAYAKLDFCSPDLIGALKFQNRNYGIPIEFKQQGGFSAIVYQNVSDSDNIFPLSNKNYLASVNSPILTFAGRESFLDKIGAAFCEIGISPSLWYKNDDGSVFCGAVQQDMIPVLKRLNKMYSLGIIDREFVKQTEYMVRSKFRDKELNYIGTYFSGSHSAEEFMQINPDAKIYVPMKPKNLSLSVCINADKNGSRDLLLSTAGYIVDYLCSVYTAPSSPIHENTDSFRAESRINPSTLNALTRLTELRYADMIINGDVDTRFPNFVREWKSSGGDEITAALVQKLK